MTAETENIGLKKQLEEIKKTMEEELERKENEIVRLKNVQKSLAGDRREMMQELKIFREEKEAKRKEEEEDRRLVRKLELKAAVKRRLQQHDTTDDYNRRQYDSTAKRYCSNEDYHGRDNYSDYTDYRGKY